MNPRKPLKIFIVVALVVLFGFIIFSLENSTDSHVQIPLSRVSDITRVLMHQPHDFTFLVKNSDRSIGKMRISTCCPLNVSIVADVSDGDNSWIEYGCGNPPYKCKEVPDPFSYWRVSANKLAIHIHSGHEIGGAEWVYREGKVDKKSQTVVIQ